MRRLVPYPLMMASLLLMWLLLTDFTVGQLIVGIVVALLAGQGLAALHPASPRLRRWDLIPKLIGIVLYDIVLSNIEVVQTIVRGDRRVRRSGFVNIPLELRDPIGLAILSVIVTSTPGTAWMDYDSSRSTVLLHVLDLVDEEAWVDTIKDRYEFLLREIFE